MPSGQGRERNKGVSGNRRQRITPLRDDVDPVIGGSIARCILCRVHKTDKAPRTKNRNIATNGGITRPFERVNELKFSGAGRSLTFSFAA